MRFSSKSSSSCVGGATAGAVVVDGGFSGRWAIVVEVDVFVDDVGCRPMNQLPRPREVERERSGSSQHKEKLVATMTREYERDMRHSGTARKVQQCLVERERGRRMMGVVVVGEAELQGAHAHTHTRTHDVDETDDDDKLEDIRGGRVVGGLADDDTTQRRGDQHYKNNNNNNDNDKETTTTSMTRLRRPALDRVRRSLRRTGAGSGSVLWVLVVVHYLTQNTSSASVDDGGGARARAGAMAAGRPQVMVVQARM